MTPKREKALSALLVSRTQAEAAALAGIGESTLREYMKDAEFKERYNLACRELMREAARQAQQTLSPALRTLRAIVEDEDEQTQARITAARTMSLYELVIEGIKNDGFDIGDLVSDAVE